MCGHTRDPIIYSKFHRNPFRGFGAPGGQNLAFPITLASRFYNSLYYRTSRDNKYVLLRGRPYIHACRSYVHTPRDIDRHAITRALPIMNFTSRWVADSSDFVLLGGAKFPKMGDSLPRTPINHRTKFDAASFILARESLNHTNKNKQPNIIAYINRYIHTLPIGMCGW